MEAAMATAKKSKKKPARKRVTVARNAQRPMTEDEALVELMKQRAEEPHYPIERLLRKYGYELER